MLAKIIDGRKLARQLLDKVKKEVKSLDFIPTLSIVMIGENEASRIYVNAKEKACKETGINTENHFLDESISEEELINIINNLNENKEVNGILVQLPLPKHINEFKVMNSISPEKDVDGFHPLNIGKGFLGEKALLPATPKGIMKMLQSTKIPLKGKNAVIVGTSNIVGKPLGIMLLNENATVTYCNKFTKKLSEFTEKADVLVVAVGKAGLIMKEMVKKGAVVIDVGINRIEGTIVGDVDFGEVRKIASFITPVPGGVGPMTVASLIENVLIAARKQLKF
ncbi:MAG: bifunctional methylenetetrahydrofolate dehydrogenase/methenyltetrahydrofolate cyclohydrolase FolD [archaeon]|nr:bifunctional methylenetetrahydrofolate dehydrogenase/methenyltetrahydrofolate cyclohydrolase FolD [Candidatus Micrarchaeota archaeon]